MSSPKLRWLIIISLMTLVVGNMYGYFLYRKSLPHPTLVVGEQVDIASIIIDMEYNIDTNIISIIVYTGWNFTGSAELLNRVPSINEFIRIRGICQPEGFILIEEGYVMSDLNTWIIRYASFGGYAVVFILWVYAAFRWIRNSRKGSISGALSPSEGSS